MRDVPKQHRIELRRPELHDVNLGRRGGLPPVCLTVCERDPVLHPHRRASLPELLRAGPPAPTRKPMPAGLQALWIRQREQPLERGDSIAE